MPVVLATPWPTYRPSPTLPVIGKPFNGTTSPIQRRFEEFHKRNPEVYSKLVTLARQMKSKGFLTYGIESLFAILRWHFDLERDTQEPFKLNDHYTSRYARLIMEQERDLKGFFQVRTLKAA